MKHDYEYIVLGLGGFGSAAAYWLARRAGTEVLGLGPRDGAIPLSNYSGSMDAAGVPYERLDAGEIMRRWPQWRLDDTIQGLFQAESGIAMAARGNAAHVRLAQAHGAT